MTKKFFPDHVTSFSTDKVDGERREHLELRCLFSQVTITCDGPYPPGHSCPLACPWEAELIPFCALLVSAAFAFPIKLPLSLPTSFYLSILSPVLLVREW